MNRFDHFKRLVESLCKNEGANMTDLYVGLDFPPNDKYVDGHKKIASYLDEITGFKSVHIFRAQENLGSKTNYYNLVDYVLERYDSFIRMDDDIEVSSNFLMFMNRCLEHYKTDSQVIAISGYGYPIRWGFRDDSNVFKETLYCPMWGTGFWKDKYLIMDEYITKERKLIKNARQFINKGCLHRILDSAICEFSDLCLDDNNCESLVTMCSDIAIRLYLSAENKQVVMPTLSKTRNWGFDGSGEYCKELLNRNNNLTSNGINYSEQIIDDSLSFGEIIEDSIVFDKPTRQIQKFENVSKRVLIKSFLKIGLYMIVGGRLYSHILLLFRQLHR